MIVTLVGERATKAVWTTTITRDTDRAQWWDYEPEDYEGA